MKKILMLLVIFFAACTTIIVPSSPYTETSVTEYYPVYGTDSLPSIGLLDKDMGEGDYSLWYWGEIKNLSLKDSITHIDIYKDGKLQFGCQVKGCVGLSIDSKCYLLRVKENNQIERYLISEDKKFDIYNL